MTPMLLFVNRIQKLKQFLVQNQSAGALYFSFSNVAGKMRARFLTARAI